MNETAIDSLGDHRDALYRMALSITRDPHLAGDLVQDTFVRVMQRIDQYSGEGSTLSWMRRILHNLAIDRAGRAAHEVEGWKVREIAETQDISLPAAKQRLRRGRMALVSALADGHERRKRLEGVPMPCWDARQHVSDYLDGRLRSEMSAMLEGHLAVCPTCPPLYAALVDAHAGLGALRDPDGVIPPDVEARLR